MNKLDNVQSKFNPSYDFEEQEDALTINQTDEKIANLGQLLIAPNKYNPNNSEKLISGKNLEGSDFVNEHSFNVLYALDSGKLSDGTEIKTLDTDKKVCIKLCRSWKSIRS